MNGNFQTWAARPAVFAALVAPATYAADLSHCRGIADNAMRLACYDQAAGIIDQVLEDQAIAADAAAASAVDAVAQSSSPRGQKTRSAC